MLRLRLILKLKWIVELVFLLIIFVRLGLRVLCLVFWVVRI